MCSIIGAAELVIAALIAVRHWLPRAFRVVSGEPLFASSDEYDRQSGWPSLTKPTEPENIVEKHDPN